MKGAYKFLSAEHVDHLLRGTFRFESLESYRKVENGEIRDADEGTSRAFQSETIVTNTPEKIERMQKAGMGWGQDNTYTGNQITFSVRHATSSVFRKARLKN
jgi:hypothetical protein